MGNAGRDTTRRRLDFLPPVSKFNEQMGEVFLNIICAGQVHRRAAQDASEKLPHLKHGGTEITKRLSLSLTLFSPCSVFQHSPAEITGSHFARVPGTPDPCVGKKSQSQLYCVIS